MGGRLSQVWKFHQHTLQIGEWFYSVCLCAFHHGVYHRTGLGTFGRIAEQPVLAVQGKRTDGVFCQVRGYLVRKPFRSTFGFLDDLLIIEPPGAEL